MHDFLSSYKTNKDNIKKSPLSLFPAGNMPQIAKQLLSLKPAFVQQRYADLDFFRQQIEQSKAGLHHQPYTNAKKSTSLYKAVFLGLAILFFVFNTMIISTPASYGCGFLFSSCTFIKGIVICFCTFLSLSALTLAISLKAEKEAISYYVKKTKSHLTTIYKRKKLLSGIHAFSRLGANRIKARSLKEAYDEACAKINDKKDETLHLVYRIATAETLEKNEKEDLLNQAIEEFNERLHKQIQIFRHTRV